ncbi:unnamed protein product [Arabidopsis thaliana]|uniref:(thale cress) hypothetical protein n=1 Tax=Arabidopsis thaliana TaxID=3702 RepID=A0A7G2ETA6_ARATH|nr:unnamed protein product [Arabidopsis thaliana]
MGFCSYLEEVWLEHRFSSEALLPKITRAKSVCVFDCLAHCAKKKSKSDGNRSSEDGSIMYLSRAVSPRNVPVFSTGSFALDVALGVGGLPKVYISLLGRVVEIYGPEASGKTALALHVIAEAQKQGGTCVFPDCGKQALSLVDTLIQSGSVDVIVVDSVAALVPKGELEGEMGDVHMAMQARLMSQALRKLSHCLLLSQTLLIFINQVRSKLSTFGGFGGEETTGSQVSVKIVKNKLAPPFKYLTQLFYQSQTLKASHQVIYMTCKGTWLASAGAYQPAEVVEYAS